MDEDNNLRKKRIIIFTVIMALCFISEFFYRNPLFEKSIEIQINLHNKITSSFIINLNKFISKLAMLLMVVQYALAYLILPLNVNYSLLSSYVHCLFIHSFLKILYGSPRPFWKSPSLFIECEGSYGNPSGHAASSFCAFFSIVRCILNTKRIKAHKKYKIISILLYLLMIIFIFFVCLSRIILNVHSLNQIFHGAILGIGVYYLYFHILNFHKLSGKVFSDYILNRKALIFNTIKYVSFIIISLILYAFRSNNEEEFSEILNTKCPNMKEYKKFNKKSLNESFCILFIIGFYYSLYFFFRFCKIYKPYRENEINKWNRETFKHLIQKIGGLILIALIPGIIFLCISSEASFLTICLVKFCIPNLLLGIGLGGVYLAIMINFKWANMRIFDDFRVGTEADISKARAALPTLPANFKREVILDVKSNSKIDGQVEEKKDFEDDK